MLVLIPWPGLRTLCWLLVVLWILPLLFGRLTILPNIPSSKVGFIKNNILFNLFFFNIYFTFLSDAHPQSQITRLIWLDNNTVISTGQDCNTKVWHVETI